MKNFMIESRCSGFLRKSPRLLVATHLQSISRETPPLYFKRGCRHARTKLETEYSAIPTV